MNASTQPVLVVRIVVLLAISLGALLACGEPTATPNSLSPLDSDGSTRSVDGPSAFERMRAEHCPDDGQVGSDSSDGAMQLIFRVDAQPYLMPPGFIETMPPTVSLYADGTLITYGAQYAIAPGFSVPEMARSQLSDEGLRLVLDKIRDLNLLDDGSREVGNPLEPGGSRTVVLFRDDDRCTFVAINNPPSSASYRAGGDAEQAVQSLSNLVYGDLGYVQEWLPESAFVTPPGEGAIERFRVVAVPEQYADTQSLGVTGERTWPLETPLAAFGAPFSHPSGAARCGVVEAPEMPQFLAAAKQASILDRWSSGGEAYILYLLPLMPDERSESACGIPVDLVAASCEQGTSADYPATTPDPVLEAAKDADLIVTGLVASVYPARWTTADGRRPGACGDDTGTHMIVTPMMLLITADPLVGDPGLPANAAYLLVLVPGGTVLTDQHEIRDDAPFKWDQRVLVSLERREPVQLDTEVAEFVVRMAFTLTEDDMAVDTTATYPPEPAADLMARISEAAPAERVMAPRECGAAHAWSEPAPQPGLEAHISDAILIGRVVEVLPPRWTTADGQQPPGTCWGAMGDYTIITPVVIEFEPDPVMTHMGADTPTGRTVVAVSGGAVGAISYQIGPPPTYSVGERVLVSLYRTFYPDGPLATPAGTLVWEAKMKFTITDDGMAVGYPGTYDPRPLADIIAEIEEQVNQGIPLTPTPQR